MIQYVWVGLENSPCGSVALPASGTAGLHAHCQEDSELSCPTEF